MTAGPQGRKGPLSPYHQYIIVLPLEKLETMEGRRQETPSVSKSVERLVEQDEEPHGYEYEEGESHGKQGTPRDGAERDEDEVDEVVCQKGQDSGHGQERESHSLPLSCAERLRGLSPRLLPLFPGHPLERRRLLA